MYKTTKEMSYKPQNILIVFKFLAYLYFIKLLSLTTLKESGCLSSQHSQRFQVILNSWKGKQHVVNKTTVPFLPFVLYDSVTKLQMHVTLNFIFKKR